MSHGEEAYAHLIDGLPVDTSGHWTEWDWDQVGPFTTYDHARLQEYRDSVVVAYRLYNRIGLEHLRRMLEGVPRDAKLLDAGGGTGRKAISLAREGFADITILDHAPEWLRLADEKAKQAGVGDRLVLVEGDVRDMGGVPDDYFDHVFALGGVVTYCGDPVAAIREMTRVLKPGGELLADGIHSRLGSMHLLARMGNLDGLQKLVDAPHDLRWPVVDAAELKTVADQVGLTDVCIWSEFIFLPDDGIRIGPDTERWERVVLDLEMRYYDDPQFLGAAMLMLRARKSGNPGGAQ
jgi:ubiquinone/menaquinone biosynthesis C-methylase UbiE